MFSLPRIVELPFSGLPLSLPCSMPPMMINPIILPKSSDKPILIKSVFAGRDLDVEFNAISHLINHTQYNVVSIDSEYPGQIFQTPLDGPRHPAAFYSLMKANIDELKLIQVGLTISDAEGNLPDFGTKFRYVWEFNFCDFDIIVDKFNPSSINLLQTKGINFKYNRRYGIRLQDFAAKMVRSGLVGRTDKLLTWITFQGAFDFGYLIKILTEKQLPQNLEQFTSLVQNYFGNNVFDVKHIVTRGWGGHIFGGLDKVANQLGLVRDLSLGFMAGSNSLLALQVYKRLRDLYLKEDIIQLTSQIHNLCN